MRRRQTRWEAAALATFFLCLLLLPGARAQEPEKTAEEEPQSPFKLHPADEGAVTYDDAVSATDVVSDSAAGDEGMSEEQYRTASAETKESFDDTATWAETQNGYDVHQAWSKYTDAMVQEAQVKRAEYEAGLSGATELGVH